MPCSHPPLPASPPPFADCSSPSDLRQPNTGPLTHFGDHPLLFTAKLATTLEPKFICHARPTYLPDPVRTSFALPEFSLDPSSFFKLPLELFDRLRLDSTRSSGPFSAGVPLVIASFSVHPPLTFVSSLAHDSLSVTSSSPRTAATVSVLRLLASGIAAFMLRVPAAS